MSGAIEFLHRMSQYVPNEEFAEYLEVREKFAELIEAASEIRLAVDDETAALEAFRRGSDTLEIKIAESRVVLTSERLGAALAKVEGAKP